MRRLLIVVALATGVSVSAQGPRDRSVITIYVGPALTPDGFTAAAPGIEDSIKDIRAAIATRHGLQLMGTPESADLTLRVLRRDIDVVGTGDAIVPVGSALFRGPVYAKVRSLDVDLTAGTVHRDFHTPQPGDRLRTWKVSAQRIVDQAAAWIDANRSRILAQRLQAP